MAHRFLDTIDSDAKEYLYSTFIFVMRFQETGEPIPQVILDGRAAAWATIIANGGLDSEQY